MKMPAVGEYVTSLSNELYPQYSAGFQFLDLHLSNPILSGSIMTSSFVLESDSVDVFFPWGTGKLRGDIFQSFQHIIVYCYFYRQHTNEKSRVREFGSISKL